MLFRDQFATPTSLPNNILQDKTSHQDKDDSKINKNKGKKGTIICQSKTQ